MVVNNFTPKILFWNANGLQTKLFILYDFLRTNNIIIACISETKLSSDDILHRDASYIWVTLSTDWTEKLITTIVLGV